MTDYRVNLDIYNGPMDLLLYLIRRDELDIHDIPITKITEQYCAYVDTLKMLDPDMVGEFLVLAATLMEIKTRMLLPSPEQDAGDEDLIDPRAELVRQLLEYKAFKDAAGDLRDAATKQAMRVPRKPVEAEAEPAGKDLEEINVWDLIEAFNDLMSSVGQHLTETEIIYDDTPIELHADDILDRLGREGNMTFKQIFAGRTRRTELVGLFLALLELVRRGRINIEQEGPFVEIYVFVKSNDSAATDKQTSGAEKMSVEPGPEATGRYVPDRTDPLTEEKDDDNGTEVAETGY